MVHLTFIFFQVFRAKIAGNAILFGQYRSQLMFSGESENMLAALFKNSVRVQYQWLPFMNPAVNSSCWIKSLG